MGVPVSPRNIFPSNIQGLPTWYEVRVSEAGHLGRRGGVDIMVAMNPATFREDVDSLLPGGYLVYDSSKPLDRRRFRSDVNWLGIPLTEICLANYEEPRQRQLFKNIVYVGALSTLLDMEFETVTGLVADQFRGKDRLIAPNVQALELGSAWVRENLDCPIGIRVRRSDAAGDRILVNGNSAAAPRLRLRGGDGGRLVSHHPVDLAGRRVREPLRAASRRPPTPGRRTSRWSRRRTSWPRSGWRSARAGTAPAASLRRAGPGSRS